MALLNSSFYIAQTYGCGVNGQSVYSQCAGVPSPQGSSTAQNIQDTPGSSTAATQSNPSAQSQLQQTATFEQSKDFLGPSGAVSTTQQGGEPSATSVGLGPILLFCLIFVVFIAVVVLLVRHLRRTSSNSTASSPPAPPPQK